MVDGGGDSAGEASLRAIRTRFAFVRSLGDGALRQVSDEEVCVSPGGGCNSVAVIVKHLRGNIVSRFTDFLTSDGEKAWRDRDGEFEAEGVSAAEVRAWWAAGWEVLFGTLDALGGDDLAREVRIRGEPHSVALALMRSLDHTAYHVGQLVWAAKLAVGASRWETLTIPRGGTGAHNRALGYEAGEDGASDGAG